MATILIADDDTDICELVAFKLAQDGHDVHTARDGDTALILLDQIEADLVVLDVMMPRRTGLEVCRAMRATPAHTATPVILLTAKSQELDIEKGFGCGADDYVIKPFSPRELASRVRTMLARAGV